jgi:hypothetical protein
MLSQRANGAERDATGRQANKTALRHNRAGAPGGALALARADRADNRSNVSVPRRTDGQGQIAISEPSLLCGAALQEQPLFSRTGSLFAMTLILYTKTGALVKAGMSGCGKVRLVHPVQRPHPRMGEGLRMFRGRGLCRTAVLRYHPSAGCMIHFARGPT